MIMLLGCVGRELISRGVDEEGVRITRGRVESVAIDPDTGTAK